MRKDWKPCSGIQSMPVEKKLGSTWETKCGSWPSTAGWLGHLRSSTTNARDHTLWVNSSIGMLTNWTSQKQCRTTTFSTCHNSINTHLQYQASHRMNLYRWSSMTGKSWRLIIYLTPTGDIGSSITSFRGPDADICVRVGCQRKSSGMLRSWSTNSTAAIQESWESWGKGSIWCSFSLSSLIGWIPVQMASAWVLPPSDHSQVEVEYPCTPNLQDNRGIHFMSVCVSFSWLWRCSPQGKWLERG